MFTNHLKVFNIQSLFRRCLNKVYKINQVSAICGMFYLQKYKNFDSDWYSTQTVTGKMPLWFMPINQASKLYFTSSSNLIFVA